MGGNIPGGKGRTKELDNAFEGLMHGRRVVIKGFTLFWSKSKVERLR